MLLLLGSLLAVKTHPNNAFLTKLTRQRGFVKKVQNENKCTSGEMKTKRAKSKQKN